MTYVMTLFCQLELTLKSTRMLLSDNFLFLESRVEPNPERLYLDDTDVLILHNPGKIADKAVEDIQSFLQRGGGVIWFAGNNQSENESIHAVTALKLPKLKAHHEVNGEGYYSVLPIQKDHPILIREKLMTFVPRTERKDKD